MADDGNDFFNDLAQSTPSEQADVGMNNNFTNDGDNNIPRPKRIACIVCRKRKLRCDGKKPSCGTCSRLGHNCAYDEVRKKSGPKRGYVKQLEARLAQVETLLKNHEPDTHTKSTSQQQNSMFDESALNASMQGIPDLQMLSDDLAGSVDPLAEGFGIPQSTEPGLCAAEPGLNGDFSWEMISLGLEEPLPTQDVIDELTEIYFDKVYPTMAIIHRPRYFAAMSLAPNMRPPVCLRYIMWCIAASLTPKYSFLQEHFYTRARKYAHLDEMRGHGEDSVSVGHCQAWIHIGMYEFKVMYFPRAWQSVGKACRLAAMMNLNRLDGVGLDVKQCIPPPRDWTDREERRRTFWFAFCSDRYASIGTGWPMTFDERDIRTNLPASEDAFLHSKPQHTSTLTEALSGEALSSLTPYGGVVLTACLFGRNLTHLHRTDPLDNDADLNGEFWKRHRAYDHILLNISMALPSHLRLPQGIDDPNTIFTNMCMHTSTICLHQASIFKAEKNRMSNQIITESRRRCLIAADQIASLMKMVSHTDLSKLNPFSAFCLYVAARVFAQYLKARRNDDAVKSSLQFLLAALNILKAYSSLTESFLMQLELDLTGTEIIDPLTTPSSWKNGPRESQFDSVDCSPIFTIRQSQSSGVVIESTLDDLSGQKASLSPDDRSSPGHRTLPSRQKPTSHGRQGYQGMQGLSPNASSSANHSPYPNESHLWSGIEMDVSPEQSSSDRHPSASELPSPATVNSSSNISFTPPSLDRGSTHNQVQYTGTLGELNSLPNLSKGTSTTSGASTSSQNALNFADVNASYLNIRNDQPTDTMGVESPFGFSVSWREAQRKSDGTDAFPNDQFDQIIEGMGWSGGQ